MTSIAIVGGGRAATLHAEAALAAPGVDLVGVGGRPGSAADLSAATGAPDLPLEELAARADGMVIAVASEAAADVVGRLPVDMPVLVESPVLLAGPRPRAMTGANLLHSDVVKRGLRAINELGEAHHLRLRGRALRPVDTESRSVLAHPFAGAWPVLLLAAGAAAVSVRAQQRGDRVDTTIELSDGRTATAELEWVEPPDGGLLTELEAAGTRGVVTLGLWPIPTLEIDGRPVAVREEHPLVALGFVEQMRRFAGVCDTRLEPWPPLEVGLGVTTLISAGRRSAAEGGRLVLVGEVR